MSKNILISFAIVFLLISSVFLSVQKIEAADTEIKISVSPSPSSIPVYYLLENSDLNLKVDIHKNRNIVISKFMKDSIDMALLSTNEAAKLYNKDVDVKVAGVHTWGIFYLVTTDDEINDWKDLKDKNISLPAKGGPMDIVFSYLADKKDININNDLKVRRGKVRELSQLMINDMTETALLRETFTTQVLMNNSEAEVFLNLQDEWKKETGLELPQSSLVLHGSFANSEKNKETIIKFNEEYKKAVEWVNNNPKRAAEIAKKYMNINKEVSKLSTPRLNLNYKKAANSKKEIENYFEILKKTNSKTIGGEIPDENFYFQY
ncbi:MAG: ABC transporter substrate-binding protein [Bacillota bacterium]